MHRVHPHNLAHAQPSPRGGWCLEWWWRSLAGGPRDYQGFWHRITKAHPLLSYSRIPRFQESRVTTLPQRYGREFARCTQPSTRGGCRFADKNTPWHHSPDALCHWNKPSKCFFSSQQLGTGTPLSKGSQAAHTSCVEGEEDFVFGHSSPFNGLMDKITGANTLHPPRIISWSECDFADILGKSSSFCHVYYRLYTR